MFSDVLRQRPPAQLLGEISERDLLTSAISLGAGMRPEHLSEAMLAALRRVARVSDNQALLSSEVLSRLQRTLRRRMTRDEFEEAAGSTVAAARSALIAPAKKTLAAQRDATDLNRGWGWQLLPEDDRAFREPRYLAQLVRESGPGGRVLNLRRDQTRQNPFESFADSWKKIAPTNINPRTIHFALNGTDANNSLYYIASRAARKRLNSNELPEAEILAFDGVYGGGGGRIGRVGLFNRDQNTAALRVPSPDTPIWKPTDPAELRRLRALEDEAIEYLEKAVSRSKVPIGGLLLEPILGARGVRFYRPEFLTRLRETCDRLQIPIFADEVLTGGGRTGKFFGYQNYPGFEPDYVTFGKGLQVSGVAQTDRGLKAWGKMPYRSVTLSQYNEPLLKSAQIMNRVREDRLMENAEKVGASIVEKLRAQSPRAGPLTEAEEAGIARGKGMLIYSRLEVPEVRDTLGRLMPPLTLTKADADRLLGPAQLNLSAPLRRSGFRRQDGGAVKLRHGSIVEGSVDHGGIQPHYKIDLEAPAMKAYLAQAKEIGASDLPFWEKIARIGSLVRQNAAKGWAYDSPTYLQLIGRYKASASDIPLHTYLENSCGVCREQAMLYHLGLEEAGFDSRYLNVRSYEDGVYVEDHAITLVKYKGEDWIADSRSAEQTGRRWKDASSATGIQATDPVVPMTLPPYSFDPSGTRFEPSNYPRFWIPESAPE